MEPLNEAMQEPKPVKAGRHVIPLIVCSQFCGTSLWFASNGVMADLMEQFRLPATALGDLTASVQFGFISGTLVFSLLTLSDRFAPSRVFFWSALLGALTNLGLLSEGNTYPTLLLLRFLTGFFLAGIYPVGMKIASDYFDRGLGTTLGYLVGALVLGTAFPHLLGSGGPALPWQQVIWITSLLAVTGGLAMRFLPDGPFRKPMQVPDLGAFFRVFRNAGFRAPAFGYFGHMWELYAFWAFVPAILQTHEAMHPASGDSLSFWSFLVIGIGGPACVLGGYLSRIWGERRVARAALLSSGACCLLIPWAIGWEFPWFVAFLMFWGMVVVADSPLFSTLVARNADPRIKGTALTISTCIGFAITIVSIEIVGRGLRLWNSPWVYTVLALGPVLGLLALRKTQGPADV